MHLTSDLAQLFARDLKRLRQEIEAFPDDATLWRTVPGVTNPAGNLTLHLEGNLREYIGRQLAGIAYQRHRDSEFNQRDLTRSELCNRIASLTEQIPAAIGSLNDADLARQHPEAVLGHPTSTHQVLASLLGHLNYHLGQIDYLRRTLTTAGAIPLAGLD